jgi:glycosyltransferase involved in cell wall biosynthesis
MRILYLTFSFQHPSLRGHTRCYHFLKELSRRHEVTLLSATLFPVPDDVRQDMAAYTKQTFVFGGNGGVGSLLGRLPRIGARLHREWEYSWARREMKATLKQLIRQGSYDVLVLHGKVLFPVIRDFDDLPVVIDMCDATSLRLLRQMAYSRWPKRPWLLLQYLRVRSLEKEMMARSRHLAFISCRDRDAVLDSGRTAEVVPIGVDTEFWRRQTGQPSSHTLIFVGVMSYAPNVDAVAYLIDRIVPRVRQEIPDLEVYIVGRDPSSGLREKASRQAGVHVTGFVDDVRPYLERSAVAVAPIRFGAGIQNKLLEAMAMEVPVVTTELAAEGLRVKGGSNPPLYVAGNAEEFTQRVVTLLQDPVERARLARLGRTFVQRNYVWSCGAETLEQMCFEAVAEAHSGEHLAAASAGNIRQGKHAEEMP